MLKESAQSHLNQSWDAIHEALTLDYQHERLATYYHKRATTYEQDVRHEQYTGPQYMAHYLSHFAGNSGLAVDPRDRTLEILDAGCGTGLVGIALRETGYRHIDGFDLCDTMVAKARQTGAYRSLISGCNMLQRIPAYEDNQYDVTLCCGVFTTGHVPPIALRELIRVTKAGGVVLVSTRKSYYETTEFKSVYQRLQQAGHIKLIDGVMDGPYLAEEGAHYWAFEVL
jgi:ubiquinone/menaquinone biosynthesis C-methylase UbiE